MKSNKRIRGKAGWFLLLGLTLVLTTPVLAQEEPDGEAGNAGAEQQAPVEDEQPTKFIKLFVEEWKWSPNVIRVAQGTRVTIEAVSIEASRRFDLKAYGLKVRLPQDKPVTFEFVADKKGKFRWKCGRPCGNGCAKLRGTLIVE